MSNAADLLKPGVFDIRGILAERDLPEDVVHFYVDEKLGYQIKKLNKAIETYGNQLGFLKDEALADEVKDKLNDAQTALEDLGAKLATQQYTAHIRSITRRAKRDIQSKALAAWPIKRDLFGRDDSTQEFERTEFLQRAAWAEMILSVEDPDGNIQQVHGSDDALAIVTSLREGLPDSAVTALDEGLAAIDDDGEWWNAAALDQDF